MHRKTHRALVGGLTALAIAWAAIPKPPLREGLSFSQAVFDREDRLLRLTTASDDRYRLWTSLSSISPSLIEATLLREDRAFRWHPGFNPISLLRAAWRSYVRGDRRMGGSTITMQLARIRYGIRSKSVEGKLAQIIRSIQLERHYSKREILEAYLSLAPYGYNIEGVAAASLIYFGKEANRLTVPEALTLAVIPQNPTRRAPVHGMERERAGSDLARARAALFEKWISKHPEHADQREALGLDQNIRGRGDLPFLAPHFVETLLQEDCGLSGRIPSTLDLELQKLVERQVKGYLDTQRPRGVRNAAVLLLDHRSMDVVAALGSADYFDSGIQGQVVGYRAKRSPGSLLKPFAYALGFDQGLIHPLTMLKDTPSSFSGFSPENFDRDFSGPLSAREALLRSRNVPAVEVASRLRRPDFYGFLRHAGINLPRGPDHYGLAPVLGGAEVTMGDLARLYALLANAGALRPFRTRLDRSPAEPESVVSPEAAFMVLDILKDMARPGQGFRQEWTGGNLPIYWKTGTSSAFRDAWTVGIAGQYVLAVWLGNFDGEGNPALIGIETAAPLFFRIADALRPHLEDLGLTGPARMGSLAKVEVCAVSGRLPAPHCPHTLRTWFLPGTSPIETCDIHRLVPIDKRTGERACLGTSPNVHAAVFEFWPSDLLTLFRRAGVPRRIPPPENPRCPSDVTAARGSAPKILSPETGVTYARRAGPGQQDPVPLIAVTDADVRDLYWFEGEAFLGRASNGAVVYWNPKRGRSVLRVIDDHGRGTAVIVQSTVVE